jgi:beta-lactamase regulating signal transducer with metallopeptidase domain
MSLVIEMVLRSSLVLAVGLAALSVIKKQPAALRHWMLAATLALAAGQPLMNQIIPAWNIASPSAGTVEKVPAVQVGVTFELPGLNSATTTRQRVDWIAIAYRMWLAGALISLAVLFVGAIWLTWLTSQGSEAGVEWQSAGEAIRRRLEIRRRVRIVTTQCPAMLVTWGVIRPVILLPKSAASWPADRIHLVLAHEMAHLVRRDWLVQLLAEMLRAINWFNPLFWIACARLRRESEYACDDIVLELGTGGTAYATHLVDLARAFSAHGRTWLPAPSIARPSTLEKRVRAMLNPELDRHPVSIKSRIALAAMLLTITLPIAAATQSPATPSGVVQDPSGRPLADASVLLKAVGSEASNETRTDANGAFKFVDIPAGNYELSVSLAGFQTHRQDVLLSGGNVTLNVQLAVGTLQETITVRGGGDEVESAPRYEQTAPSSPAPACSPTAIGGQLTPPMKLRDVRPRYLASWVKSGIEGEVLMQALIGVDGKVKTVEVTSPGRVELVNEAIAAVSQWEFSPTYLNCEPIEVKMNVTVSFKIAP